MARDYAKAIQYTAKILDAWLPHKIAYDRIPGFSVGIVHKGKLVYAKGFGSADLESQILATNKTCYRIASISKTFTAVAVMQLVEQGKLDLNDQIEKHLSWFNVGTKITIRQLLSHTGGVFRDGDSPHWADDVFPDSEALKKSISDKTVVFESATRFKYSNFGFAVLGEIIKTVSGVSYDEYVTKNIINRLEMTETAPDFSPAFETHLAKGYLRPIPGQDRVTFPHSRTHAYSPATGFLSNVPNLAKYLTALSLKSDVLVSKKSKRLMIKKHWPTGEKGKSYGLGFYVYEINKRKIVGHDGGFAGFITQIALDVENDIGVITLLNTNDGVACAVNTGIFETIYSLTEDKEGYAEEEQIVSQEKYEGIYRSRWGDQIVTGIDTGLLVFDPKTNSPTKHEAFLRPSKDHEFTIEPKSNFDSPGETAIFTFDGDSKKANRMFWGPLPIDRLGE